MTPVSLYSPDTPQGPVDVLMPEREPVGRGLGPAARRSVPAPFYRRLRVFRVQGFRDSRVLRVQGV